MVNKISTPIRCSWCGDDPLYQKYHDEEWGVPNFEDRYLFECLMLEGAQAGLSWITVLRKRDNYRLAFDQFDAVKIAKYSEKKLLKLKENTGIIRHEGKIRAAVGNAKAYLNIINDEGSFANFLWRYVDGKPIQNQVKTLSDIAASTDISTALSKDLKKAGFKFVGPTITYAFMQAVGMVNDHCVDCHCYKDSA